jgi:LSD1 subclass zinc finger protein
MSEIASTFECPSCGASLQNPGGAASMKCGYCGTTVVVPEALRAAPRPATVKVTPSAANIKQMFTQAMEMGAILRLARNGDRADAIRLYQENTGASAEQAGLVIDAMVSGNMPGTGMENEAAVVTKAIANASATREGERERRDARQPRRFGCSGIIVLIILIVGAYYFLQFSTGPIHDFLTHLVAQLNLTKFLP